MRDQVHVCESPESSAQHARDWLLGVMQRQFANPELPDTFSIALAGGSTPKRLYELIAELPVGTIDWRRVFLLWGDERNVPADHADSNFRMVKEALLDKIDIPAENILPVPNPGGDANAAAKAYEDLLNDRFGSSSPIIDCVLLGMGDDVHTASLFPGTEAIKEKKRSVVANFVPQHDTWRISLTAPLINRARHVAFFVCGEKKNEALSLLWHAPFDPNQFPAQLVRPENGTLWFFLDKPALGNLPLPDTVMVQLIS